MAAEDFSRPRSRPIAWAIAPRRRWRYTSPTLSVAYRGLARRLETNRAARSECPPRSSKKSASAHSARPGNTFPSAAYRAVSSWLRGAALSRCSDSVILSGAVRKALRSTLPDARRGSCDTTSKCAGTMYAGSREASASRSAAGVTTPSGRGVRAVRRRLHPASAGDRRRGGGEDECHHLLDVAERPHQRRGRRHAGLRGEGGFNFAQLHAEPAHLDLAVRPAQPVRLALLVNARKVAGAVEPRLFRARAKRVRHEPFRSQFRPPEITDGEARPEDAQFSLFAGRQRAPLLVHHHQPAIRQRRADGHRPARLQLRRRRGHARLGRSIGVEQAPPRPRQPSDQRLGARLPAQIDQPHRRQRIVHQAHQGRHGVQAP